MRTKRSLLVLVGSILALADLSAARAQDVPVDSAAPPPNAAAPAPSGAEQAPLPATYPPQQPISPTPVAVEPGTAPRTALNSINAELLGPGIFYSVNYERMFLQDLAVRVGFSFIKVSVTASGGGTSASSSSTQVNIPLILSYTGIRSDSGSGLDLGAGVVLGFFSGSATSGGISASGTGFTPWGDIAVGYRLQPLDGGFQFRIGLDLLLGPFGVIDPGQPGGFGMLPFGHMSFGASF